MNNDTIIEEMRVWTHSEIDKALDKARADERAKVINDIRNWLHKTFDKQNNIESKFIPSIVLNEMVFVLLDNYLDSNK